jgi:sigma-B regulation protein RsbU (phosphoserine phosphatase)
MIALKSLRQRTFLFVILPTFLVLLVLSASGFLVLREVLLKQWGEIAVAKLQYKAYEMDADLRRPKNLFGLLHESENSQVSNRFFLKVIELIQGLNSVVAVHIAWPDDAGPGVISARQDSSVQGFYSYPPAQRIAVSKPEYSKNITDRTISLVSNLTSTGSTSPGRVEIVFSFDVLIQQLLKLDWWKSHKAYLVDEDGNVLSSTSLEFDLEDHFPMRSFGTTSKLQRDTLRAMQENPFGTVFGAGIPPDEVSGYYHLKEAPWTIVVIADGKTVLEPILKFRHIYFISISGCIILILLFIRGAVNKVIARIKMVSAAAESLASGVFGQPLIDDSRDEVGELTVNFNKMSHQLRHRLEMKEAIGLARNVQQNLLPRHGYSGDGVHVQGVSLYCDETGGDYYDIVNIAGDENRVAVMVGDVVGHGISAALLMSSIRAYLRCRFELPGTLSEIIGDVNRLLCKDTRVSGNFITLFVLELDIPSATLRWVRAGHEPAFAYCPADKNFSTLMGRGLALGVDPDWVYEAHEMGLKGGGQIILLSSDGAWEVENSGGEQFGRQRIKNLLIRYSSLPIEDGLKKIVAQIDSFKGQVRQHDDITLVMVQVGKKG